MTALVRCAPTKKTRPPDPFTSFRARSRPLRKQCETLRDGCATGQQSRAGLKPARPYDRREVGAAGLREFRPRRRRKAHEERPACPSSVRVIKVRPLQPPRPRRQERPEKAAATHPYTTRAGTGNGGRSKQRPYGNRGANYLGAGAGRGGKVPPSARVFMFLRAFMKRVFRLAMSASRAASSASIELSKRRV